ncbi:Outer membrane porin (plasmid) [Cupriavidus necator H850]|uniref:porin n=1 Tax=Cupriavidus necator TaxID=106590 RepID=UPI00129DFAD2|nr:porin [Cupriavidus necator]KAI3605344.1 Outer membrane porin [Cupriavidus necator H850]
MKHKGMATAALVASMGSAFAQSNVTLYGVADMNIEYANHVGNVPTATNGFNPGPSNNVYRMNSGGWAGSRSGLRGTENLGGGLKSLFVLENGFNLDSGTLQQSGRLFGRQAFVGLAKDGIGQIAFGRQYTSLFDALANFSPTAFATQYEPVVLETGANFREDNTIKYKGQFGPVTAVAHWSFGTGLALPASVGISAPIGGNGEVPGAFRRDTAYGAAVAYSNGPVGVTVAYDQWNPTIGVSSGTMKKAAVGASYSFSDTMRIMGGYRWGQNKNAAGELIQRDDFYWIGATYQVTPALGLALEYNYDDMKNLFGANAPNPWQVSLLANYTLSKRTDLYLSTAYAKNAGLILESLGTFYANSLALGNSYALANGQSNMLGVAMGVRHKF